MKSVYANHHNAPQHDSSTSFNFPTLISSASLSLKRNETLKSPPAIVDNAIDRKNLNKQYVDIPYDIYNQINITSDDPKPATFIARKLFSDFVQSSNKKIELILAQENKDKPIFKSLLKNEDPIYDQILEALGAIGEFCLPSLLKILIEWYHHQLDIEEHVQKKITSLLDIQQQQQQSLLTNTCDSHHPSDHCGSPHNNNDSLLANDSTTAIRSPTPSSPDTSNQTLSITSTLPLEYQSTSLTVVAEAQHSSSAANTSNSTATNISSSSLNEDSKNTIEKLELVKTRKLLIEYTFCQALIEIFKQLYLHPGHEDLIGQIENIASEHFKYSEANSELNQADSANVELLADKFAEVIGVLAQTRFKLVRKRFITELNELRAKESTPFNIQCIVTLLSGMKFFRVKMAPIEEFEASFQFLQECAEYFLEVRHKSIRLALANLFVEILVPLASIVKNEVKIPCLKNFVDTLWAQTLDMCNRKKHSITLFPLVTCLLCVSQRSFFLTNWGVFLNMCLSNLKNRDQKKCRVALESLYRLIWIYMIRIKCESNNITQNRLSSIVDALFPRGSRTVVPRDASLDIFVHIIQFIAQERLDFAMRHIIFDLLSVERPFKMISSPERMNIALQAFLHIAESLQHKEGDPPMPTSIGVSPIEFSKILTNISNNPLNVTNFKRTQMNNKMLNDDIAKSIGLYQYYNHIQKSFNDILKALDIQYGRPLLLTTTHNINKEPDDMITNERKPKIDLFKTCIAAIPRLMPDGMSRADLIDLLSRMTVHVDEQMRKNAFESLQILITDFADWRLDAIEGFTSFIVKQIDESLRYLVDNALKMLLQFLISWRTAIKPNFDRNDLSKTNHSINIQTGYETISSRSGGTGGQIAARKSRALTEMRLIQSELNSTRFDRLVNVIQKVEGASLVMLCSCNQPTRKIAANLLRESRSILKVYSSWTCMEQFGFKSPDEVEEDDLSASLRGSLSADNLSRITAISASAPVYSSVTSMNTQAMLSTSVSKMCISNQHHQHDPYDSDVENNLAECLTDDDNSTLLFWIAAIMLESGVEQEFTLAMRLLKKILPNLPFEQTEFVNQIEKNLREMRWENFPGIQTLVLKGCYSSSNYDISIALLDHLTPILKLPICSANNGENSFPFHVIALLTQLLSNYDDPSSFSLNIARRIAIWCNENSQKLENLATVMNLYSRRSFSKDGFQWIKCVVKYLYDAFPQVVPNVIPLLADILETGPQHIQRLIAPVLYCVLTYTDVNGPNAPKNINKDLARIYAKYLGSNQWNDAIHIFKLIISRSSYLASSTSHGRELPGRIMDFTIDVETIPFIAKAQMLELAAFEANLDQSQQASLELEQHINLSLQADQETVINSSSLSRADSRQQQQQQQIDQLAVFDSVGQQQQLIADQVKWRRSWLSQEHVRKRLVSLLMT